MRRMTRGVLLLSALLATLAVAVPASAAEGLTVRGVLVSVSTTSISVKDAKKVVITCARAAKSPSLDGYAAGDRVQAACLRARGKFVLAKIRRLPATSSSRSNDSAPTRFGGVVTALSDSSISLHDGNRDLTCSIDASSPSTASVKVGSHLNVACSNDVLVAIAPVTSSRAYEGTVTAVSTTSITVHTPKGDGTCGVGDGSPSLSEIKVGDRVLAGCKTDTNQLVLLKKLPAATGDGGSPEPPPATHKTVGAAGTVSAVSTGSITVHTDGGDVTCSVGDGSPRLAEVHVGDRVSMACVDGALLKLVKL
jgi:hypothetical protein